MLNGFIKFTAIICAFTLLFCSNALADEKDDLSKHPVYSAYQFGRDENVIDVGIQPLGIPIGVTAEVMKRDRILKAYLKGRGREIRFHPFLKGADMNFFNKRGDIEAAFLGEIPTLSLIPFRDIVVAALAKQDYSSLVTNKQMQLRDLKGRKIGYVTGSTAHYNVLIALQTAGIKESDVKLVPMDITELPDALVEGKVDAIAAFEPAPTIALSKNKEFSVIHKYLNSTYFLFSLSFVRQDRDSAAHIIASYMRALRWMKKDRKNLLTAAEWTRGSAAEFQKRPYELTAEQIADITDRGILSITSTPFVPLTDFKEEGAFSKTFKFLKIKEMIDKAVTWEKVKQSLDRSIMSEVAAAPAKYRLDEFDYE